MTSPPHRAFVLLAVLVIGAGALLVATGVLFMTQADLAGQANAARDTQSRALAWSGAQALLSRLHDQRDRILDSALPELDAQYTIYDVGPRLGIVRLLPLTPDGSILLPEAGRLDCSVVNAESLVATGLVAEDLAHAIVDHRDNTLGRPYQSVAELLTVPGMTPEVLYGPLEDITVMGDAAGVERGIRERMATSMATSEARGLADVVTVYAVEPAMQRDGRRRINLNVPWSEELGRRVDERFGAGASAQLKALFDRGTEFDDDGAICRELHAAGLPPAQWPDILDALTTEAGEFHFGRLDLNTAPREALLGLAGITPEQASQIVRAREGLSREERTSIVWPAIAEILPPEAYEELAGRLTTRCWTYRVRIAAGEVDAEDPDGPLPNPLIWEVVFDLSDPQPRIAYLRDVTLLQTAAILASNASLAGDTPDGSTAFAEQRDLPGAAGPSDDDRTPAAEGGDQDRFDGGSDDAIGFEGAERDAPGAIDRVSAADEAEAPADGAGEPQPVASEPESEEASQRRRIGRWQRGRAP